MKLCADCRARLVTDDVTSVLKLFQVTLALFRTPYRAPSADRSPGEPAGDRHVLDGSVGTDDIARQLVAFRYRAAKACPAL